MSKFVMMLGLALASLAAQAQTPAAIFSRAPPAIQAYLRAAMDADAIKDPLQRCLAFPDLPGNRWPAGQARAQCEYLFGRSVTTAQVAVLVERKAYAALDALFQGDLERHFPLQGEPSEIIHRDFEIFDGGAESDRLSAAWLENAPQSAFALAARGRHFSGAAIAARGTAAAAETSDEKMRLMSANAFKALHLLGQAAAREPRLTDAHASSLFLGMLLSEDKVQADALRQGEAVDPACRHLAVAAMRALRPRWGGSYEAMQAYARKLEAYMAARPLVADSMAYLPLDLVDTQLRKEQHGERAAFMKPMALALPFHEIYDSLVMNTAIANTGDRWEALTFQLQWMRFSVDPFASREAGRNLLNLGEPDAAAVVLTTAFQLDSKDADTQLLLGRAYSRLGRYDDAVPPLKAAMTTGATRERALLSLLDVMLVTWQQDQARIYVDMLNAEYPANGEAWYLRVTVLLRSGTKEGVADALEKYLKSPEAAQAYNAKRNERSRQILAELAGAAGK